MGFKKGDTFPVKRTINNHLVVITDENKPNLFFTQVNANLYGTLTGTPEMG